ncbi:hypothetical protein [Achromobacter aloeverae]
MAIDPVSPVRAPLAPIPMHPGPAHDAGRRGERFEASPGDRRATLTRSVKLWRSYSKGGVKKRYVPTPRKKTAREEVDAFLHSANGAQLVAGSKIDDARSRERKERLERVAGAAGPHGYPRLLDMRENTARKADEHRLRLARKGVAAIRREAGGSAAAREGGAAAAVGHRARLAEAREDIRNLPVDAVKKAVNAPLDRLPDITGIQGLRAEDIRGLCASVLDAAAGISLGVAHALATPHPDEKKTLAAFGRLVDYAAWQNERGVPPRAAIAVGMERADTRTVIAASIAAIAAWSGHGGRGALPPVF